MAFITARTKQNGEKMKIYPRNKRLLIEVMNQSEEKQTQMFQIPTGAKKKEEFLMARVISVSPDCDTVKPGVHIIFPANVLEEVEVSGDKICFVSERQVCSEIVFSEENFQK